LPQLGGQEPIAQIGHRELIRCDARGPARVQVVGNLLVLLEGFPPAVAVDTLELAVNAPGPAAEVVRTTENLLLPLARRVRAERESGIGLARPFCFSSARPVARIATHASPRALTGLGGVAPGGLHPAGGNFLVGSISGSTRVSRRKQKGY